MEPNLAESIYIRSSIKFLHFVPFCQQIWLPRTILVSDWLMLKKSSPLKLLGQMEPNLAGSIYIRSSIKLLHLVPFDQQTWPLLLKIEQKVNLHVFGNKSKTIKDIRKMMSTARSIYPEILKKIWLLILELLPFLAHLAFNLLLRNHWANCNQTLVEWSLNGHLPKNVSGDPDFQPRWLPS